jgi:hypothetical protein
MKTLANGLRFFLIAFALLSTTLLSSCNDDNEKPAGVDQTTKKNQVEKVLAFREDMDFVNRFVEQSIPSEEGRISFTRSTISRIKEFAPCVEAIEEELPDGSVKVSMDFGDGCTTEEGTEVSGKVAMILAFNETGLEYSVEFIDYAELNGDNAGQVVNGTVTGSFSFDIEAEQFRQQLAQDLTVTYENGTEAKYKVAQSAELTEGGLRVTSLTTSGNFADGGAFAITLQKTLLYDLECDSSLPVEGEELLIFQGNTIVVNYGTGTCDNTYAVK